MKLKKLDKAIERMKRQEVKFEKVKEDLDNSKELIIETQKEALYKVFLKSKLNFEEYYNLISDLGSEKVVNDK